MCKDKTVGLQSVSNVQLCADQLERVALKNSGVSCLTLKFQLSNLNKKFSTLKKIGSILLNLTIYVLFFSVF